jgi:hypothetical protein
MEVKIYGFRHVVQKIGHINISKPQFLYMYLKLNGLFFRQKFLKHVLESAGRRFKAVEFDGDRRSRFARKSLLFPKEGMRFSFLL